LKDSKANLKMKTMKEEGVGAMLLGSQHSKGKKGMLEF
jgi:hypothetical protein